MHRQHRQPRRHTPRQPLDRYDTPPHYLDALRRYTPRRFTGHLYEPCVGGGHIATWVRARTQPGSRLWTNDLNPRVAADFHLDARRRAAWEFHRHIDWTITNPPFSDIERILDLALRHSTNVISLARLSFLEPTRTRRAFFTRHHRPAMVIVLPRYQFTKPSKDTMTCCWVGWGPLVPPVWTIDLQQEPAA